MSSLLDTTTMVQSGGALLRGLLVAMVTYILYKMARLLRHIRHLEKWFDGAPGPADRHWFSGNLHLVSLTYMYI